MMTKQERAEAVITENITTPRLIMDNITTKEMVESL